MLLLQAGKSRGLHLSLRIDQKTAESNGETDVNNGSLAHYVSLRTAAQWKMAGCEADPGSYLKMKELRT